MHPKRAFDTRTGTSESCVIRTETLRPRTLREPCSFTRTGHNNMQERLEALAYLSTANVPPTDAVMEKMLESARAFNAAAGVTGALLLHDITFFQYFEGPPDGVAAVYERIKRSGLHRDIIELMRMPIERRQFSGWLMGFAEAPQSVVLQLEQSRWVATMGKLTDPPPGVALLLDFWNNARRHG